MSDSVDVSSAVSIEDNASYSLSTVSDHTQAIPDPIGYYSPFGDTPAGYNPVPQASTSSGVPMSESGFGTGVTDWFKSLFGFGNTAINSTTGLPAVNGTPGSVGGATPIVNLNPDTPSNIFTVLEKGGLIILGIIVALVVLIIFLKWGK